MLTRVLLFLSAILAFFGLLYGFAVAQEALGDWTDTNPQYSVLAWSLWMAGVMLSLAAAIYGWRWSRRRSRPFARTDGR